MQSTHRIIYGIRFGEGMLYELLGKEIISSSLFLVGNVKHFCKFLSVKVNLFLKDTNRRQNLIHLVIK